MPYLDLRLATNSTLGEYWIVNQILSKGLHNADQDCLEYTTMLMDKLEKVRRPSAIT